MTDWSNVKGSGEVATVFKKTASFYGEFMDSFPESVSERDFDGAAFELPKGYSLKTMEPQ